MKKLILIGIVVFSGFSCQVTDKNNDREITSDMIDNEHPAVISFEEEEYNFGEMSMGSTASFSFKFTNTGESALIIHSVKAACGCTVLKDWPKQPIMPGESGEIPVEFNPKGPGAVKKYVSIIANTKPATTKVYLSGKVVGPE